MKTELEKQIEIAEHISEMPTKGYCSVPNEMLEKKNRTSKCELCPVVEDCKHDDKERRKGAAKAFLAKNKPEGSMISKEELIEKCKGKVFKCESQEEWDLCVSICKKLDIQPVMSYAKDNAKGFGISAMFNRWYDLISPTDNVKLFLEIAKQKKPQITITKNSTVLDNPSVGNMDGIEQEEFCKLDKILDNIKSLEEQKRVIEDRLAKSRNQLILNDGNSCQPLAVYVIGGDGGSNDRFVISEKGSELENIHYVNDWLSGLLNLEKVVEG
jgi:hypothetical protein